MVRIRNRDEIETPGHGAYPAYWTLSHRWGDPSRVLQLRKTTEDSFRHGIALEQLSPTFRDAVLLVYRLGYRYLWIDSLCIFQDSLADWQTEANAMVDVYRHSFCNISAAGASSDPSNAGLFAETKLGPFTTNVSLTKGGYRDTGTTTPGLWIIYHEPDWDFEVEWAPINSRGWVVQERFLSARVLHFTRHRIYWECFNSRYCASEPTRNLSFDRTGARNRASGYKEAGWWLSRARAALATPQKKFPEPVEGVFHQRHWGMIVGIYAGCVLTQESDRFLAMSGIAKAFQHVSGDEYLAGLWKSMLYTNLMWCSRASEGVPARRSTELYAPSWSWASVVGGNVELGVPQKRLGPLATPLIKLVEARVVPEPPEGDPMGLLRSAELEIECMPHYYRWNDREGKLAVFRDEARMDCYFRKTAERRVGMRSGFDLMLDTSELVERFAAAGEIDGVCVPVHGTWLGYKGGSNEYLMLEHDAGSRFRRIGLLRGGEIGEWISELSGNSSRITLI